jgi:hypothetical protein
MSDDAAWTTQPHQLRYPNKGLGIYFHMSPAGIQNHGITTEKYVYEQLEYMAEIRQVAHSARYERDQRVKMFKWAKKNCIGLWSYAHGYLPGENVHRLFFSDVKDAELCRTVFLGKP